MSLPGGWELFAVLLIAVLVFGSRIPKIARNMGQAGKEFKEGLKEGYQSQPLEGPCPFCSQEVPAAAKFCPGCGKSADEIVAEKNKRAAAPKAS